MTHPRFLTLTAPAIAAAALLAPTTADAGGGGGGGGHGGGGGAHAGGGYHGGGYGNHGGGYGYRGYYPYHHYGYGYGFGVGIYLGYPFGSPWDYYGPPYLGYAPEYGPPPPAAPAPLPYAGTPELAPVPGNGAGDLAPGDQQPPADLAAHVAVRAPADAEVWFGAGKTRQTGAVREFVSPPLVPGQEYTYEVRARWTEGGREVVQTRRIDVSAGSRKVMDFTRPAPEVVDPPEPAKR